MKKISRRNFLKAAAVVGAAAAMTACGGSSSSSKASAGGSAAASGDGTKSITMCISTDVGDLSPFGGDSGGRHHTYRMMYDCLTGSKGLGQSVENLEGQIAKSWEVVDPYTVNIEIYDYVKDSQGNAIKASDVVYSYEQAIASGTMEKVQGYLDSIEATGDYTLTMKLTSCSKGAMEWCMDSVPIISEAWFSNATDAEKTGSPATTGAYTLVETVAGSHTTLKANPDYWQTDESLRSYYDVQTFDTVTVNVVTESAMRVIALENGETDLAHNVPVSEISTFMNDDGSNKDGWNVYPDENGRLNVLMFNNDNSPFADNKALRQAVLYAIDFAAVYKGYGYNGQVAHDFSPDIAGDYIKSWNDEDYYDYNVDKAKQLLSEAGYPDGGGLTISLMYQNSSPATAGMTVIQSYLQQIGITVELNPCDQALFNSYKYDDTKWDIIVDSKSTTDYVTAVWENCFDTHSFENGSACFTHDDKLQELLETAAYMDTTSDAALQEFHDYLKEQAYGVGMFWYYTYYVAQDGITEMPQDGFGNVTASTVAISDDYCSVV